MEAAECFVLDFARGYWDELPNEHVSRVCCRLIRGVLDMPVESGVNVERAMLIVARLVEIKLHLN